MTRRIVASLVLTAFVVAAGDAFAAGFLTPRDGSPPIKVQSHRVVAEVSDGLAKTTVRQTFVNPHDRILEAVWAFPLPEGAALLDVAMEVGGQRLEGLLVERKKARAVYDEIVRKKRDPALVEQIGRNLYRLSVFPVVPNEPTVVELTYIEHIPLSRGEFRYVYPLGSGGEAATTEEDLTVSVTLLSSAPLVDVTASKDMEIVRAGPGKAVATMERTDARLSEDVVVTGRVRVSEPTLTVRTWRGEDGDGIFLAVVTPPALTEDRLVPRDVTLVLDTSGSMRGEKIAQARVSALYLLGNLRAADRVNIVRFSSTAEAFAEAPVPANEENLLKLRAFVTETEAKGGTNLADAIRKATAGEGEEGRAQTVVILSDGRPTVGDTDATILLKLAKGGRTAGVRIYPFGVGTDVDAGLLRGIARVGRGRAEIFRPGGEIESRLTAFLDRTSAPVLTDVKLTVQGVPVHDVFPRPLPDAYLGEQVVIAGRYRDGGKAEFQASAILGDRRVGLTTKALLPAEAGGAEAVRNLFARMKLDWLEEQLRIRTGLTDEAYYETLDRGDYSTADEIVEEIVSVSLEHRVQCAYTSFLVLLPEDRGMLDPRDVDAIAQARERAKKTILDPIIRDAKVSDHNESDNDLPFEESLGKDDFFSDAPFEGPSTGAAIGIGGGAGGAFGGRAGHRNLRAEGGGSRTETAVDLALEWLKEAQNEDGSWDEGDRQVRSTALAVLNFLGAGETHKHGRYKNVVRQGVKWLKQNQDIEGCFGPRDRDGFLVDHAIATLAMAEIFALTQSPLFRQSSQTGLRFLESQDLSKLDQTTWPWVSFAWKSSRMGGLHGKDATIAAAVARYDATSEWPTVGHPLASTPRAMAAAEILVRMFAGESPKKSVNIEVRKIEVLKTLPTVDDEDHAALYFGTLAMFQCGGPAWKTWNDALKTAVIETQVKDGEEKGSWEPTGAQGAVLGRVGVTALRAMCMQIYYRYARTFGTK